MKQALIKAALLAFVSAAIQAPGQVPVPPPQPAAPSLSSTDLDQLLGPIALYPDPLIAEILPAATLPQEVVMADRYVAGGGDPNLIDQQPWDPSVKALARYPTVLKWMDDNLPWTTQVGQAFLNQQQDVMDAIQDLRSQAQSYGSLQTTPQENVVDDDGEIEIVPADPQVIYVPVYDPAVVYCQRAYGRPFITFGVGFAIGGWLNCDFDWRNHDIHVWGGDHPRPADWWSRRPGPRSNEQFINTAVWHPVSRPSPSSRHSADRGFDSGQTHVGTIISSGAGRGGRREAPASPSRRQEPVERPAQEPRTQPARGSLFGEQNARDTRQSSNRGAQSLQAAGRSSSSGGHSMSGCSSSGRSSSGGSSSGGSSSGGSSSGGSSSGGSHSGGGGPSKR